MALPGDDTCPACRSRALGASEPAATVREITVVEAKDGKLMIARSYDFIVIEGKFPRFRKRFSGSAGMVPRRWPSGADPLSITPWI